MDLNYNKIQYNRDLYYSTIQYHMYLNSFMNFKKSIGNNLLQHEYEVILRSLNHSIHKLYKLNGKL